MADIKRQDNNSSEEDSEMLDCEINQEHSHYVAQMALEDIQERGNNSFLKISDKLINKICEDSMNDNLVFEIVDESGFAEFRSITKGFLIRKLKAKLDKVHKQILNEVKSATLKHFEKISVDSLSIIRYMIDEYSGVPNDKSFCCFKKKVIKSSLKTNYDLSEEGLEMKKILAEFKKYMILSVKDDGKLRNAVEWNKLILKIEDGLAKKVDKLLDSKLVNIMLNNEVDKYSQLFNLNKIVSKQERKIKKDNRRLFVIDDNKTLNECIICMENERNVIFHPCLHLVCCKLCGFSKITIECPSCITKIEKRQIIST